jgi:hypothetical protein
VTCVVYTRVEVSHQRIKPLADLEININSGDHQRFYKVWLEVYTPDLNQRKGLYCWSSPDPGQNLGVNKLKRYFQCYPLPSVIIG